MIKHLVIPGGAIYGFSFYGAIKELNINGTINFEKIETIYATSVGCILAVILCLKYDWNELDNYIINRPWHNLFHFTFHSILSSFTKNGIFDILIMKEMLLPLFNAKEISIDITLQEFYDMNGIELHFFTIDLSLFKLIDVSYKTFPHWTIMEAIYSSACAPVLFEPFKKDNIMYVDGGLLSNCPIKELLNNKDISPLVEEIFYINTFVNYHEEPIIKDFNLLNYIIFLFTKIIIYYSGLLCVDPKIKHVLIQRVTVPLYDVFSIVNSKIHRIDMIDHGIQCVKNMMN